MNTNPHTKHIYLKDGRVLTTTDNGFTKWVSKNDLPTTQPQKVSDQYYNKAKRLRITKKHNKAHE